MCQEKSTKVLSERMMELMEVKVDEKQREFRKGNGCVDQYLAIQMITEKYLG